jgi:hypothetical protein
MEKSSGVKSVRTEISVVAGPREWGDTRESWLARVPRRVSTVTFRTVKALWYGEIDDPDHWAARDIRRAAEIIEGRKETAALASQFVSVAGALNAKDADFHSSDVAALIGAARALRGQDRT